MKVLTCLIVIAIVQIAFSGTLVGPPQTFYDSDSGPKQRVRSFSRNQLADDADANIRAVYWYYLPNAFLTYVANIQTQSGCLYLHLYKNYIGTFLAITNYADRRNTFTINTFVRIGEGCNTTDRIADPIVPRPFVISLDLGEGEYFVPHETDTDIFEWDEIWARGKWFKNKKDQDDVHKKCQIIDKFIKKQYWYYLTPDTKALDSSESNPGRGCYCSFTYINYLGLFQVIAQWDYKNNAPLVNTFVRLGDGSDPQNVSKCRILPSVS